MAVRENRAKHDLSAGPEHSLRDARATYPKYDYAALTPAVLAQLTREHGVDFATALWYDRVRRAEPHRAFIVEARVQTRRKSR